MQASDRLQIVTAHLRVPAFLGIPDDIVRGEAAYRRSDLFERHRTLMQQWADYLAAA